MNLLLVEDEARVADFIQRGLSAEGWSVAVVSSGEAALELVSDDGSFDVIVLDLMLPGISGQDVCRRMRARQITTPVLMLSALADVEDRVRGLRLGADDYLTKPFDFEELLARLEALVRRAAARSVGPDAETLRVGALEFDTRSLDVRCGDTPIALTRKERDLLRLFLSSPRKIFSRTRILNTLWGIHEDPQTNVVDVYIARLRKKLGVCGEPIETVRGVGYRFVDEVRD
jgi:DNA-binding response OmpR family regulator